ncbi:MAG: hypothetical protein NDF58_01695 [archaeon YNP-LCB-024-027]|nr:hypothetical protein [Candidatus Culexarchaeum yellowstonense]
MKNRLLEPLIKPGKSILLYEIPVVKVDSAPDLPYLRFMDKTLRKKPIVDCISGRKFLNLSELNVMHNGSLKCNTNFTSDLMPCETNNAEYTLEEIKYGNLFIKPLRVSLNFTMKNLIVKPL